MINRKGMQIIYRVKIYKKCVKCGNDIYKNYKSYWHGLIVSEGGYYNGFRLAL